MEEQAQKRDHCHSAYLISLPTPARMEYSVRTAIEAWEVGAEVGNVRNNRPELMERVGLL